MERTEQDTSGDSGGNGRAVGMRKHNEPIIALLALLGAAMLIRLALWLWLPRVWMQLNGLA